MKIKICPSCGVSFSFEGRSRLRCPACTAERKAATAARGEAKQIAQRKREAELYAGLGEVLQPITIRTLEQTGKIMGLTTERVRQIERQALWKLRHRLLEACKVEQIQRGVPLTKIEL